VRPGDEKLYVKRLRTCMDEGICYPSRATKLFDFLYLGGEDDAKNLHLLSELGITHIINCAAGYCSCVAFAKLVVNNIYSIIYL